MNHDYYVWTCTHLDIRGKPALGSIEGSPMAIAVSKVFDSDMHVMEPPDLWPRCSSLSWLMRVFACGRKFLKLILVTMKSAKSYGTTTRVSTGPWIGQSI